MEDILTTKDLEKVCARIVGGYTPDNMGANLLANTALYYARRCQILEGQLTKTRADLREIVSDATTIRVQASLPEDPYPQDPNEV